MSRLWEVANLYKLSISLFALDEAGVLDELGRAPHTAGELAERRGLDPDALAPVLDLMVAAQVLQRDGDRFALDPTSAQLVPLLALERRMCESRIDQRNLASALAGRPPGDPMTRPDAAALWPVYRRAMAVGARALAPHLVRFGRIAPRGELVDLGGADGTLALQLARMVPGLTVTVVDRAVNAEAFHARRAETDAPVAARFCAADLQEPAALGPLLAEAGVIVASNVMHLLAPAQRDRLLAVIHAHAPSGCKLLVYDQFVSRERVDSASCLVVDWLLCGYRFDCSEAEFAAELTGRYADVRHKRVPGLPGALVAGVVAR